LTVSALSCDERAMNSNRKSLSFIDGRFFRSTVVIYVRHSGRLKNPSPDHLLDVTIGNTR